MGRLTIPRFVYPVAYDETLSYYEQVMNLQNQLNSFTKFLEDIVKQVEEYTEEELAKFRIEVQEELKKAYTYTDSIKFELETKIVNSENRSKAYTDLKLLEQVNILNEKIDRLNYETNSRLTIEVSNLYSYINSKLIDLEVINGFTGKIDSIQNVLDDIINMFRTGALTSKAYDNLNLTAKAYDDYMLTAKEYDFNGKNLLV